MTNEGSIKNRGGRPLGIRGIRASASRHSYDCLKVLVDVANSEKAPETDRVRAAQIILAYAAGNFDGEMR